MVEARAASVDHPIELLVNNAGVGSAGAFIDLPIDGEVAQVDLNVTALVRLTHAVLPGLVGRGRGGIINVSSLGGFQPAPLNATYSATKAFVLSFTEAVHEEVLASGVRVSCLCPGFTHTGFQARSGMSAPGIPEFAWQTSDQVAEAGWAGWQQNGRWWCLAPSTRRRRGWSGCSRGWRCARWPSGWPARCDRPAARVRVCVSSGAA